MVTVCVGFMSFTSCLFWLSLYLQQILRLSPLKTAIHLIPQAISALVVNVLAAFALSRIDNRLLLMIGTISYVASAALYATMSSTSSYWAFIFPGLIISVIGADLQYNVSNMYVLGSLPKALQSTAGGLFNTVLQLSSAVGLGMSTAVWEGVAGETGKDGALDPEVRGRMEKGYTAMFWFVCALSGMALFGQWHLKIGTQGYVAKDPVGSVEVVVVEDEIEEKEKTDDLDGGRGLRV